ncbi:hypothetical protein COCSADRAFT_299228 [Bipolaris sorokiniana ND90Pr]|uniref:Uncharacterized protein n=1 Tax=Cochliobolus sativus (strain ND90Pr / ATCC 201652) TaxID=665912 RepID=M2SW63_COCSN|nr:uncharacterized protein COCSADRAFT_299228 [Bipolaris sorokiniana ND90Pr]EMD66535.1 hypothetical protein COCSADRAFT_299228 [Bipolaris sorokiniana ND90Pr]
MPEGVLRETFLLDKISTTQLFFLLTSFGPLLGPRSRCNHTTSRAPAPSVIFFLLFFSLSFTSQLFIRCRVVGYLCKQRVGSFALQRVDPVRSHNEWRSGLSLCIVR